MASYQHDLILKGKTLLVSSQFFDFVNVVSWKIKYE